MLEGEEHFLLVHYSFPLKAVWESKHDVNDNALAGCHGAKKITRAASIHLNT